jgi:signal peptidase II
MLRNLPAPILKTTLGLAILVIGLDQLSKWLILAHVMTPPRLIEVTGFFNLKLTFNQGISFGLFSGESIWQPYVLSLVAVLISLGLVMWLTREPRRLFALAVGLIVGGALGNVVDRLYLGAVVDFLDFHLGGWHWPAFNLADSAISIGVALILYDSLFPGGGRSTNDQSREVE